MTEQRRPFPRWSERTRLHRVVAVVDAVLIVAFGVLVFVSSSQALIWAGCGVVVAVVLLDYWLSWQRLGELGRR